MAAEKGEKGLTKDCIFTALILLMEQKEYKYITVTDIARKAGVSRMTYYRAYSSKEDILIQQFRKISISMTESENGTPQKTLFRFFTFFQEYKKMTMLMKQADLMELLIQSFSPLTDFLYDNLIKKSIKKDMDPYGREFYTAGLFAILVHWLEGGTKESPEEMAGISLEILVRS